MTIDPAGRVVLPEKLKDELRLTPGDTLDVTVRGDEITLRPRRHSSPMHKKEGIWVFTSGKPLTQEEADDALRKTRSNRGRKNAGRL